MVISLTFLTLTQRITATGTFWLYAGILVIAWLFVYFLVPETAGLNLEDIQELFRTEAAGETGPTYVMGSRGGDEGVGAGAGEDGRRRRRGQGGTEEL